MVSVIPGMPQSDIQGSQQNVQQNKSTDPGHKHRYKNAGLDSQEMRRRREEEGREDSNRSLEC